MDIETCEPQTRGNPKPHLIFWLVETISYSIFQRLLPVIAFSRLVETSSFRLKETDFRANNGFCKKKIILFPLNKNSYSTSRNDGLFKKVHFHFAEKLLSLAGIYIQLKYWIYNIEIKIRIQQSWWRISWKLRFH